MVPISGTHPIIASRQGGHFKLKSGRGLPEGACIGVCYSKDSKKKGVETRG